jgi:hypothetical protein
LAAAATLGEGAQSRLMEFHVRHGFAMESPTN